MAILAAEVQFYLANPNANQGYQGIGQPGYSLGKYMSTTQVPGTYSLDNLFLDITGAQNVSQQVDYQCVFIMNNTVSGDTMHAPYAWIPTQLYTAGGANIAIGMDAAGVVPYNTSFQQAVLINTNTSPPPGVAAWYQPSVLYTSGCPLPDIPPQYCVAVWLQRTATNSSPLSPQTFSLECTFASNA
jgi:hypothetical protein